MSLTNLALVDTALERKHQEGVLYMLMTSDKSTPLVTTFSWLMLKLWNNSRNAESAKMGILESFIFQCRLSLTKRNPAQIIQEDIVKRAMDFTLGWHMEPITDRDSPQTMKHDVGVRLSFYMPYQMEKLKGSWDFVGINYSTSAFVALVDNVDIQKPSWEADSRLQLHFN